MFKANFKGCCKDQTLIFKTTRNLLFKSLLKKERNFSIFLETTWIFTIIDNKTILAVLLVVRYKRLWKRKENEFGINKAEASYF